jgi:undecaprenyl-diphosphatase
VLLDLHWLSDVVGGLSLGWGWFALCAAVFGGRLLRPTAAADVAAVEAAAPPGSASQPASRAAARPAPRRSRSVRPTGTGTS